MNIKKFICYAYKLNIICTHICENILPIFEVDLANSFGDMRVFKKGYMDFKGLKRGIITIFLIYTIGYFI